VAPIFMHENNSGGHEWIVEFKKNPQNMDEFTLILDKALKSLNSDYEAKRYQDMTLALPVVHQASKGLFYNWLKQNKKLGGQNKVPRLSNKRTFVEELLTLA
jgi:hypothetical protein